MSKTQFAFDMGILGGFVLIGISILGENQLAGWAAVIAWTICIFLLLPKLYSQSRDLDFPEFFYRGPHQ